MCRPTCRARWSTRRTCAGCSPSAPSRPRSSALKRSVRGRAGRRNDRASPDYAHRYRFPPLARLLHGIRGAMIAAIVLAAGFARRMGRQKLLLDLNGAPVVRWSVDAVVPHVDDCVVVTGQDDAAVRAALRGLRVRYAVNPRPQDGQGSSIAVGIAALEPTTAAVLVVL